MNKNSRGRRLLPVRPSERKRPLEKVPFSKQSDSSLALPEPQATIERLRRVLATVDRLSLPVGANGTALLDALELADQIRSKVREKARLLLLDKPGAIPGWYAETQWRRQLRSRNGADLLETLQMKGYTNLSADDLLQVCAATVAGLEGFGITLDEELVHTEPVVMLKQEN